MIFFFKIYSFLLIITHTYKNTMNTTTQDIKEVFNNVIYNKISKVLLKSLLKVFLTIMILSLLQLLVSILYFKLCIPSSFKDYVFYVFNYQPSYCYVLNKFQFNLLDLVNSKNVSLNEIINQLVNNFINK